MALFSNHSFITFPSFRNLNGAAMHEVVCKMFDENGPNHRNSRMDSTKFLN